MRRSPVLRPAKASCGSSMASPEPAPRLRSSWAWSSCKRSSCSCWLAKASCCSAALRRSRSCAVDWSANARASRRMEHSAAAAANSACSSRLPAAATGSTGPVLAPPLGPTSSSLLGSQAVLPPGGTFSPRQCSSRNWGLESAPRARRGAENGESPAARAVSVRKCGPVACSLCSAGGESVGEERRPSPTWSCSASGSASMQFT
mmetsp:Transcript_14185/g.35842  ORF Transcript_14185/g.35842 Transcript_14185/m.35842 type:complete len:204 (-) Transcript_14185:630-1241(-)